jgi:PAS domain S-box-containing protein
MQPEMPGDHADQTPFPSSRDDEDSRRRVEVASQSLPAVEDNQRDQTQQAQHTGRTTRPVESERLVEAAFDRAIIGMAFMSPQGRLLRVNERFCDVFGYRREELATRTWQDRADRDAPDASGASGAPFQRLPAGELDAFDIDTRALRKDGTPSGSTSSPRWCVARRVSRTPSSPWCRTSPSARPGSKKNERRPRRRTPS